MKVLGWISMIVVLAACNNAEPAATTYKNQLTAGNAATGTPAPGGNNNTGTGDATKGKTSLTTNCGACHKILGQGTGAVGHDLVAADADKVKPGKAASTNAAHSATIKALFATDGNDMAAALSGTTGGGTAAVTANAANGETLLKASCDGCHAGPTPPKLDKAETDIADDPLLGQDVNPSHGGVKDSFTDPQKKADIIAAMKARPAAP